MQARQLLNCRVSEWVPVFEKVTFPTRLIGLPESFVAFLIQDGVALAEHSAAVSHARHPAHSHACLAAWSHQQLVPAPLTHPVLFKQLPTRALPAEDVDSDDYQDWDEAEVDQAEASTWVGSMIGLPVACQRLASSCALATLAEGLLCTRCRQTAGQILCSASTTPLPSLKVMWCQS